jgi:uncharacterized protein DUF1207
MRPSLRCLAAVVVVSLAFGPAEAAPVTDDYIKGYAAAILGWRFNVQAQSLQVSGGTIQLARRDLANVDESAVVAALSKIEGVSRVVIVGDRPAADAPTARPLEASVTRDATSTSSGLLDTGFLPGGLLFRPLLADPRWPHFFLGYRKYFDDDDFGSAVAGGIGENLPLYRWSTSTGQQWDIGALALVTPIFDRDHEDDLLTEDYLLGLFLGWRHGSLAGLARVYHTSSHLGDELALRGTITRVNLSYETLDVRLGWDFTPEFRLYGGVGYLLRRDPSSLDPWWLQAGLEYRSAWRAWQILRPVAALDLQSRQTNDWQPALSLRAGAQFDSVSVLGRNLQLLFEYYIGDSREGQFYTRDIQYIGFGAHLNF